MLKKKTSKKQGFSLDDMPTLKIKNNAKLKKHKPHQFFENSERVAVSLLESLIQNDTEAFIEILDTFLKVNSATCAIQKRKSYPKDDW